MVDVKTWPMILDMDDMPKKKLPVMYRAPTAEMLAYLDFSVSTTGMLAGIKMSHAAVTSLCRAMKLACELYPSRHIALCLDPYSGLGFALWCLSSIYSGHHSILIPPSEVSLATISYSRYTFSLSLLNCFSCSRDSIALFSGGSQSGALAVGGEPVQGERHVLLVRSHGAVHKGPRLLGSRAEGAGRQPGVREDVRRRRRGEAADSANHELQQAVLRSRLESPRRLHLLRLSSQYCHLLAG